MHGQGEWRPPSLTLSLRIVAVRVSPRIREHAGTRHSLLTYGFRCFLNLFCGYFSRCYGIECGMYGKSKQELLDEQDTNALCGSKI